MSIDATKLSSLEDSNDDERIYGAESARASRRLHRVLEGLVAGGATWLLLEFLGVPHIFGIGGDAGLVPFALTGALLSVTRFRFVMMYASLSLLTLAVVVGYTPLIIGPAKAFIRTDPLPAHADAVVALSAGVTPDGYVGQQGLDRLLKALALVKAGVAPRLVITREERTTLGVTYSTQHDQLQLAALAGVPQIISTSKARSTHDEALGVARLAQEGRWTRVVVVTSPFHSRRACRTFEKVGLAVSCIPSDSRDIAVRRLTYAHDRVQAFAMWLYETAGTLRYRQLGWI